MRAKAVLRDRARNIVLALIETLPPSLRARAWAAVRQLRKILRGLSGRPPNSSASERSSASAWHKAALALAEAGHHEEALIPFAHALHGNPRRARAHRDFGRSLAALGRHPEAADAFTAFASLARPNARGEQEFGSILLAAGRRDDAIAAFERALALDPDRTAVRRLLRAAHSVAAVRASEAWKVEGQPNVALCLVRPLCAGDLPRLDAVRELFSEIVAVGGVDVEGVRTVAGGWRDLVASVRSPWLFVADREIPDPGIVAALRRRTSENAGVVGAFGAALYQRDLLNRAARVCPDMDWQEAATWLSRRARSRAVLPEAKLAAPINRSTRSREAWFISDEAGDPARNPLFLAFSNACTNAGYQPVAIRLGDADISTGPGRTLPHSVEALSDAVLIEAPVAIHATAAVAQTAACAVRGLAVALVAQAASESLDYLPNCQSHAASMPERDAIARRHGVVLPILDLTSAAAPIVMARQLQAARFRIGVAVGGGMGNMIQCSPAIRRLAEHFGLPVDVVINADSAGCDTLFAGAPWVRTVFCGFDAVGGSRFDALFAFDCAAIDFLSVNTDWIDADWIGVSRLPFSMTQSMHEAEFNLLSLHQTVGVPRKAGDAERYFVGAHLRRSPARGRVGLHAGCKPGIWSAKRWPHFPALARELIALGFEVTSFGSPDEHVAGTIDATGTELSATVDAIAACDHFISNDSGLMHVADALGVPLTALFAPSSVIKNGPLAGSSKVVQLQKACSPCQFDKARLSSCVCIGEIAVEEVLAAFLARNDPPAKPHHGAAALPASRSVSTIAGGPAAGSGIGSSLERKVQAGKLDQARRAVSDLLQDMDGVLRLGPDFKTILTVVRKIDAEGLFIRAVRNRIADLVARYPNQIRPIFECAALALSPRETGLLALAAAPAAVRAVKPALAADLLDLSGKFCPASTTIELLRLIDGSPHAALLRDAGLAQGVGDTLQGQLFEPFVLAGSGLTGLDFASNVSPAVEAVAALRRGDRDRFIRAANRFLLRFEGAAELATILRSFTHIIAGFRLDAGEIWYQAADSDRDTLRLAVTLNDCAKVAAMEAGGLCAGCDAEIAAWRSRLHDYRPLNEILHQWLGAVGAEPVVLEGSSRMDVLRSFQCTEATPDTKDHGVVSVIMTVFDPEPVALAEAIESVLRQTYRNLELLIVDDASPGGLPVGLAQRDPRIRLLRSARNAGPYHCRNMALAVAKGRFIAFHDADDVAHPQRLALQVSALARDAAAQVCFATFMRFDEGGGVQFEPTGGSLRLVTDGVTTSVYRRTALDLLGPFAPVRTRGDIEMRARIITCYGEEAVVWLDAPLMCGAGGPSSLSHTMSERHFHALALFRQTFRRRVLPKVVNGRPAWPMPGPITVPFVLRSEAPD